jgi:thioredoxin reductase
MDTPHNDAEPPDGDTQIEHALEHLKVAERDLEQAKKAERRAEGEIREAEHEIEEAIEHRNTEIIVNSRPREIHGHEATFEQVVQLAFPGGGGDQNTVFSMTYRHAASTPHAGELGPHGKVQIKNGTIFNVTRTVRS